jgi:hypothetical protein
MVTDISWLTRQMKDERYNPYKLKAEDIDEFEEDILEMLDENVKLSGARYIAFVNLLIRLEHR